MIKAQRLCVFFKLIFLIFKSVDFSRLNFYVSCNNLNGNLHFTRDFSPLSAINQVNFSKSFHLTKFVWQFLIIHKCCYLSAHANINTRNALTLPLCHVELQITKREVNLEGGCNFNDFIWLHSFRKKNLNMCDNWNVKTRILMRKNTSEGFMHVPSALTLNDVDRKISLFMHSQKNAGMRRHNFTTVYVNTKPKDKILENHQTTLQGFTEHEIFRLTFFIFCRFHVQILWALNFIFGTSIKSH